MTTALIFGITGQDGSYLADLLLDKGYNAVIGVARRTSTPSTSRIKHLLDHDRFELVEGDITDPICVFRLLQDRWPDEVYGLAAQSHVHTSFSEASHTTDVTYKGCLNILEALRTLKHDVWPFMDHDGFPGEEFPIRFYQASSSEMFGSAGSFFLLDGSRADLLKPHKNQPHVFQDEFTPFHPQSPYAIAKLAAHHLVRLYRESYGLFACSGILFNHESPRRGENFVTRKITKYVAQYHKARLEGRSIEPLKLGNLDAKRDWGHAEDYVRAMWLMLQQEKADDFVVATGETHTVSEFLHEAFFTLLYKPDYQIDPSLCRPSEVPVLRGDSSKAQQQLGWKPKLTFQDLVRQMVYSDLAELGIYLDG